MTKIERARYLEVVMDDSAQNAGTGWLKVSTLAAETGFNKATLIREIQCGALIAYRIGKRDFRVPRAEWERYLEQRRSVPVT
jgi:hypothetical protein